MATERSGVCHSCVVAGEAAVVIAIGDGNDSGIVHGIFSQPDQDFSSLGQCLDDHQKVLHLISSCTEEAREVSIQKLQQSFKCIDTIGTRILEQTKRVYEAKLSETQEGNARSDSSIISIPFDWITACERGELTALNNFILHHCSDFKKFCEDQNDTPLHHIHLRNFKEYQEFLGNPLFKEMINVVDFEHATPLHRALERQDIMFAEVLLTSDRVDLFVKDKKGKAATDLLADLCNQRDIWDAMCKRTGIDQLLKTSYNHPSRVHVGRSVTNGAGGSMSQMRETLVVVAALLATLTFAAAFTLPGGYNNTTGDAILAKKASFIVFIIADAYAMCCAMLVLFCLIATIAGDHVEAMKRVKRTKFILIQSLYGTLVAFAAAVFTVIADKSLWSAIVIFVMCSLVAVSANNPVVCDLLDKFFPIADVEGNDQTRSRQKKKKHLTRRLKRACVCL